MGPTGNLVAPEIQPPQEIFSLGKIRFPAGSCSHFASSLCSHFAQFYVRTKHRNYVRTLPRAYVRTLLRAYVRTFYKCGTFWFQVFTPLFAVVYIHIEICSPSDIHLVHICMLAHQPYKSAIWVPQKTCAASDPNRIQ